MLTVRNLTKRFRSTPAVDDLSLTAAPGEIVALLGPNGAGKSTTFLCLAGLLRPDAGTIAWNDAVLGARRGRSIALIPETPEVYPNLTVWEHLAFVAGSCRLAPTWTQRANELLERLRLTDSRDALGLSLSKGMKQKTLIVATLLVDAPVFLFDEPMIGLDPAGQRELRELVAELRSAGKAVLVSTHMLDSARTMADRAIVMKAGREIFSGPLSTLDGGNDDLEGAFLRITA